VIVNDPHTDERMSELPKDVRAALGKSIAVPIIIADEVTGVLTATTSMDAPDIGAREERLLQHIVTQASVAIQRAQLFTQIRDALINSQESEQLVRTIIDSTPDWIFVKDLEHRFRMANVAYANSLHLKPEDVIGKDEMELGFPEEQVMGDPEKGLAGFWADDIAVMESEQPKNIPNDQVMLDGEMHIFNTYKAPLRDAEGKVWGVLGVSRDVTERERVQAAIAQRAHELSTVAEMGTQISAVLDPVQMLQTVVDLVKDSFTLYHAHIYLLDEKADMLNLAAGAGEVGRKMVAQGWQIPLDQEKSLVVRAARTHQGVIANDVRADEAFLPNELLPNTRAELAVPLMVGERVLGVLDIQSDQVNHFSDEDVSIQAVLASQVAVALQNARTYAQTQRQAEYEALINTISQKIQSTTSVENALQVAVRELGRALGASRTSVQLSLGKADKVHPADKASPEGSQ
jgi:PAS domain S-box-containing protein